MTEALDLVAAAARAASDKQAHDIVVLDVGKVFVLSDYFLIASGATDRQVRTIAEEIEKKLKAEGYPGPVRTEGLRDASWVLLDYGDFVAHIFDQDRRDFYRLEDIWSDAPDVTHVFQP